MAQPQPLQIAQHLRNAADQIALMDNLPALDNGRMLQNIMDAVTTLRTDMNAGFARLVARIDGVETGIEAVEARMQAVETRLGILETRLEAR